NGEKLDLLIDCAHNPQGVTALLDYLKQLVVKKGYDQVTFLLSFLSTKNYQRMIELLRLASREIKAEVEFVFTQSHHASAVSAEVLRETMGEGEVISDPQLAFERLVGAAKTNQLVVATGSIYLIGDLRQRVV